MVSMRNYHDDHRIVVIDSYSIIVIRIKKWEGTPGSNEAIRHHGFNIIQPSKVMGIMILPGIHSQGIRMPWYYSPER